MLRGVSLALARDHRVTVLARDRRRLEALAAEAPEVVPLALDYRRTGDLRAALERAVEERGPFALAVAWIHPDAPRAPAVVAGFVRGRLFHVLGSAAADPSRPDPGRRSRFEGRPGVSYHEVILGFVVEGGRSRWLAEGEIVRGVLEAVASGAPRSVVGTVEPWFARP